MYLIARERMASQMTSDSLPNLLARKCRSRFGHDWDGIPGRPGCRLRCLRPARCRRVIPIPPI